MKTTSILFILIGVAGLLLIPFITMQFTSEVNWSPFDFLVMGILLFFTGLSIDLAIKKIKSPKTTIISIGVILMLFFLIWAELAVGIFGTPFAGN